MRHLRSVLVMGLLAVAATLSLASLEDHSHHEEPPDPTPADPPRKKDETWVVAGLYDGQTAVPTNQSFRLTVGSRDLRIATPALSSVIRLYRTEDRAAVPFEAKVWSAETELTVPGGLEPGTDYELDVGSLAGWLATVRVLPPGPIWFSTESAPRVTGLWRSGTTLIIAFSEPMNPAQIALGFDGVNVLWEQGGELLSLAGDRNLAAFDSLIDGPLFLFAPITFADTLGEVWLRVAAGVRGLAGGTLDGDGDGSPGEVEDDYLELLDTARLPTCFVRPDIPAPCVRPEDVPDLSHVPGEWQY